MANYPAGRGAAPTGELEGGWRKLQDDDDDDDDNGSWESEDGSWRNAGATLISRQRSALHRLQD